MQFIYFHGCFKRSSHSETKEKQCTEIQNDQYKKVLFWFQTMFFMSFTSAVADRASFKNTSEMAKVISFNYQLQISKSTTLLQMTVKFYAVLSLSLCMVLILYLFPGPSRLSKSKKRAQTFSLKLQKTPKLLFSSVTF